LATVVADRDGSSAKVDDLDEVRMAGLFTSVVVVASMDRVDSAGGHRIGLIVCRVKHRVRLPEVVSLHPSNRHGFWPIDLWVSFGPPVSPEGRVPQRMGADVRWLHRRIVPRRARRDPGRDRRPDPVHLRAGRGQTRRPGTTGTQVRHVHPAKPACPAPADHCYAPPHGEPGGAAGKPTAYAPRGRRNTPSSTPVLNRRRLVAKDVTSPSAEAHCVQPAVRLRVRVGPLGQDHRCNGCHSWSVMKSRSPRIHCDRASAIATLEISRAWKCLSAAPSRYSSRR